MSSGFHVDTAVSSNHPKEVRIEAFKPAMGGSSNRSEDKWDSTKIITNRNT